MIQKRDHDNNQKHTNGFTLGMLVGGALVLLISTEKGRKILKDFSNMGIHVLSGVKEDLQVANEMSKAEEELHLDDQAISKSESLHIDGEAKELASSSSTSGKIRKFFKGAKKK